MRCPLCNEIVRMEIKAFFHKYMINDTDFTWENKIYQCRQLLCILPFYTLPLYDRTAKLQGHLPGSPHADHALDWVRSCSGLEELTANQVSPCMGLDADSSHSLNFLSLFIDDCLKCFLHEHLHTNRQVMTKQCRWCIKYEQWWYLSRCWCSIKNYNKSQKKCINKYIM